MYEISCTPTALQAVTILVAMASEIFFGDYIFQTGRQQVAKLASSAVQRVRWTLNNKPQVSLVLLICLHLSKNHGLDLAVRCAVCSRHLENHDCVLIYRTVIHVTACLQLTCLNFAFSIFLTSFYLLSWAVIKTVQQKTIECKQEQRHETLIEYNIEQFQFIIIFSIGS